MYRTDKQFMKNPATSAMRVYVGALAKTVIANDLEEKFKKHGNIVGLSLNSGFAFIQFEHEHEAQSAIVAENGSFLCGRKIVVKQALQPKTNINQAPPQRLGPVPQPQPQQRPPFQESPPKPNNPAQQTPPPPPQNVTVKSDLSENETDMIEDVIEDDRPNIRPPGPPRHIEDKGHKGGRRGPPINKHNDRDHDRFAGRFEPPPKMEMYRDNRDLFYGRDNRDFPPHRNEPYPPPIMDMPPPPHSDKNDCEIIVVAKQLTEYAEFIEQKLKTHGLLVDLLFPNEDVPIGKVLANISSRGCLYAILIMPINEEHRSITLNILHGISQEHRNIPVDDAMILISRDFESYMKGEHTQTDPSQMTLLDRHPTQMQLIFNLLAENRQISSVQYDKLIKYLQERKLLQQEYEVEEGIVPGEEADPKHVELQSRIMNILNKSGEPAIPTSITAPDLPPTTEATPILKDPTVQKALDSLMLGDMFKNIAG